MLEIATSELIPDWLSHYYEASVGPFRSLTKLPIDEANRIQADLMAQRDVFAGKRQSDYLEIRRELELLVRDRFIRKGGRPQIQRPHYMILGSCPWLLTWYRNGKELRIPVRKFDWMTVSFTYGDTFPAMRYQDGKPYRGQVFRHEELPALIQEHGLPQFRNPNGQNGPDRYIEAQIWTDEPLESYLLRSITDCK